MAAAPGVGGGLPAGPPPWGVRCGGVGAGPCLALVAVGPGWYAPPVVRDRVYELAMLVARGVASLVGPTLPGEWKLARGIRGRRDSVCRLVEWGREGRDPARRLVWFHAPSVGEALQAKAVMDPLRRARPDVQLAFTFFSPSAEGVAAHLGADVAGYVPWDVTKDVRAVVRALEPALVVFTKTEVWPVLAGEARRAGARLVLVGGTLPAGAGRLRPAARFFLRPAFARLDAVAAVAAEDAERFARLGADPARVTVTGDPGIDSAAERVLAVDPDAPYLQPFHREPRPTVVAGSTWPADETVLVPALAQARARVPALRAILAPHEPTERHLRGLEAALAGAGFATVRLGEVERDGRVAADAVVVDRVGVLAHLYTVGRVAYVGGGFHGAGLHSVLEPAAAGLPVAFGPRHQNARAAGELMDAGAAAEARDAAALAGTLARWLESEDAWTYAHRRALAYISMHRGAAERTTALVLGMLSG